MLITTISPFWVLTRNIFKFLQFPYRLFVISTILLIFAAMFWMQQLHLKDSTWKIIISIFLILNIYQATNYLNGRVNNLEDFAYRTLHEEIAGLASGEEWLPVETTREHLVDPTIAYDSSGNSIEGMKDGGAFYLSVDGSSPYYDIPFVWYKGYAAQMNGQDLQVVKKEENGLVRVMLDNANILPGNNELVVWYKGTTLQTIAYVINLAGVLLLTIWYVVRKARNNHSPTAPINSVTSSIP